MITKADLNISMTLSLSDCRSEHSDPRSEHINHNCNELHADLVKVQYCES